MLTIAQIYAIVALLVAFNVPQPTVDKVQGILLNTQNTAPLSQNIGEVGAPITDVTHAVCDSTPIVAPWPAGYISNDYALIDQLWVYTPCAGQHWFADVDGKTYELTENGVPDSGPHKGLTSYVAIRVILRGSPYTITLHSPDSSSTATYSGTY